MATHRPESYTQTTEMLNKRGKKETHDENGRQSEDDAMSQRDAYLQVLFPREATNTERNKGTPFEDFIYQIKKKKI